MINRVYSFICDFCGFEEYFLADNLEEAKQEARMSEWKMHSKRGCFCSQDCYLQNYILRRMRGTRA